MPAIIRPRNADGTLGQPVKFGKGETDKEKIVRLESENLTNMLAMTDMFETNVQLQQDNMQLMLAITDIYEMMVGGIE